MREFDVFGILDDLIKGGPGSGVKGHKTHFKGDAVEHTGNSKTIGGAKFHEFKYLEGHKAGQTGHMISNEDSSKNVEANKKEWKDQQAGFTKLREQSKKSQGDDMDLLKAGGEGTRGGQILGHTKSGKPIYGTVNHARDREAGYTRQDHEDAAKHFGDARDAHEKNISDKHATAAGIIYPYEGRDADDRMSNKLNKNHIHHRDMARNKHVGKSEGAQMNQLQKLGINVVGSDSLIKSDFSVSVGSVDNYSGQASRQGARANAADALNEQLSKGLCIAFVDDKPKVSKTDDNGDQFGTKYVKGSHGEEHQTDSDKQCKEWVEEGGAIDLETGEIKRSSLDEVFDLLKAGTGSGEGSRGGKVIGHTSGGKPIYENASNKGHKGFSGKEHHEAYVAHSVLGGRARDAGNEKLAQKHYQQSQQHKGKWEAHQSLGQKIPSFDQSLGRVKLGGGEGESKERTAKPKKESAIPDVRDREKNKRANAPGAMGDLARLADKMNAKKSMVEENLDSLIMMMDDPFDPNTIANVHENSETKKSAFSSGSHKTPSKKLPLMHQEKDPLERKEDHRLKKEAGLLRVKKADSKPWPGEAVAKPAGSGHAGGEGSHGGKVVGHTTSGKPVYAKNTMKPKPVTQDAPTLKQTAPSGNVVGSAEKMQRESKAAAALAMFKRSRQSIDNLAKGAYGNAEPGMKMNDPKVMPQGGGVLNTAERGIRNVASSIGSMFSGGSSAPKSPPPAPTGPQMASKSDCAKKVMKSELDELADLVQAAPVKTIVKSAPMPVSAVRRPNSQFIVAKGPNGVVFDFGHKTGNAFADHANEILSQNFDPVQNSVVKGQQESYQKALFAYIEGKTPTSDGPRNDNTDPYGKLDKSFDQQTVEFLKQEQRGFAPVGVPEVTASVGGELVKAQSETDAAVLAMYNSEMAAVSEGGFVADSTQKIIA